MRFGDDVETNARRSGARVGVVRRGVYKGVSVPRGVRGRRRRRHPGRRRHRPRARRGDRDRHVPVRHRHREHAHGIGAALRARGGGAGPGKRRHHDSGVHGRRGGGDHLRRVQFRVRVLRRRRGAWEYRRGSHDGALVKRILRVATFSSRQGASRMLANGHRVLVYLIYLEREKASRTRHRARLRVGHSSRVSTRRACPAVPPPRWRPRRP
mmetsp:Transcript_3512/g.14164  ORF Transcript_3512/g.14164 Transcript_3512/m.14164 type:complete len:211 (-) Transcript_3512:357-989(-)